jgi:MFS family permease
MRATIFSISALLAAVGLFMLGNGLLGTLLSYRLALSGAATTTTGLVMASYFAGLAIGSLTGHRVISSVGHIRAFAALASTYSACVLVHGFFETPVVWGALRLFEGLAIAGLFMCVESWLNERSTNETRGKVLSLYMIVIYLSQGVGQYLLTLDDATGFALLALISAVMSMAVIPVTLSRTPAPAIPPPERLGMKAIYRISPLAVFTACASGLMLGSFYSLAPAFAQASGLGQGETALFMSAAIFGGLLLQWPIGLLSDKVDRRSVIVGSVVILGAVSAAIAAFGASSLPLLLPGSFVFGAVAFVIYPQAVALANDFAERHLFVGVAAGMLLAYSMGAVVGPVVAAAAMDAIGPPGLFWYIAIICGAAAAFAIWRMRQRSAPPPSEQTPFAILPRTTPLAGALDPRGEEHRQTAPILPPDILDEDELR